MMKVLVLEDNDTARTAMGIILNKGNYWIKLVSSVEEAKKAIGDGSMPDVVIADQYLMDGTGLDFIKELKSRPGGDGVHCLLFSAADPAQMERYRPEMDRYGVDMIFKPFNTDNVVEHVARRAERAKKERERNKP